MRGVGKDIEAGGERSRSDDSDGQVHAVHGRRAPLDRANVDTDAIIPSSS